MKQNCWEYKKCGRQEGGEKAVEMGVCPASNSTEFNGVNGGKNAGRLCWKVSGTYCKGEVQGTYASKYSNCVMCDFFSAVRKEEGTSFQKV